LEYYEALHQLFIDFKSACDLNSRKVLYNVLFEFGMPMKLVRLIKMFPNETYSGVHLSDRFSIRNDLKQGDASSPLLFIFALEYAIKRVQVIQDCLKVNGTHQLLVYADDVITLGGSICTIEKNTEALVVDSKGTGLEVNADKTKYMVIARDQIAGRSHAINIDNKSFERVE